MYEYRLQIIGDKAMMLFDGPVTCPRPFLYERPRHVLRSWNCVLSVDTRGAHVETSFDAENQKRGERNDKDRGVHDGGLGVLVLVF